RHTRNPASRGYRARLRRAQGPRGCPLCLFGPCLDHQPDSHQHFGARRAVADDVCSSGLGRSGRADVLRSELPRSVAARRRLCRQDSSRGKARRDSGRAADQVRSRYQSDHRQGARPRSSAYAARPRRRGDRAMGWMAPLLHLSAKLLSDRLSSEWQPSMGAVTTIGLDLAEHVFQVHGVDAEGATVLRKQLRRAQVLAFFSRLPPCLVGLEACATAHYWARELRALGHEVRLMPAQYVKAYIKRNKHDAADAE